MMAAHEGREKIAAMLIEAGAMRGTKNDWGEDALTWAMPANFSSRWDGRAVYEEFRFVDAPSPWI